VAVTVAVPGSEADIRETVTTPVSSAVEAVWVVLPLENFPRVVEKTAENPFCAGFPAVSLITAVMALEVVPSAGMLAGAAVRVIDPTVPLTRVMLTVLETLLLAMARITTLPAVVPAV
jgi:hypothetical protein